MKFIITILSLFTAFTISVGGKKKPDPKILHIHTSLNFYHVDIEHLTIEEESSTTEKLTFDSFNSLQNRLEEMTIMDESIFHILPNNDLVPLNDTYKGESWNFGYNGRGGTECTVYLDRNFNLQIK